jgi:hypothetical protein
MDVVEDGGCVHVMSYEEEDTCTAAPLMDVVEDGGCVHVGKKRAQRLLVCALERSYHMSYEEEDTCHMRRRIHIGKMRSYHASHITHQASGIRYHMSYEEEDTCHMRSWQDALLSRFTYHTSGVRHQVSGIRRAKKCMCASPPASVAGRSHQVDFA